MSSTRKAQREDPVRALAASARSFGPEAAREKARLLEEIAGRPGRRRQSARSLALLQSTLAYVRAFPDDAAQLARLASAAQRLAADVRSACDAGRGAELENTGLPGTDIVQALSHGVTRALVRLERCRADLDWGSLEEQGALYDTLGTLVLPAESPALDDVEATARGWLERPSAKSGESGLATLLGLLEATGASSSLQAALFESCAVTVRHRLAEDGGRADLVFPVSRAHYRKEPLRRETWPLPARIRQPLRRVQRLPAAEARVWLDRALVCLVARNIEIFPLTHATPRDVVLVEAGRGLALVLAGVEPAERCALEALYVYLVLQNGVPIAYGPASPFLGACELGINFFEEFRGGETRFVYCQVMRALYHLLDVRLFYVTSYGMGRRNPAAIATGAFWFYRKLGFAVASAEIEALAQAEEKRMRAEPGYRSDARTLRRLANTAAFLDLSDGRCQRFDSTGLALGVSRAIAGEFGGDRRRAETQWTERVRRALGVPIESPRASRSARDVWTADEHAALARLAPILAQIPDLARWSARDRRAVARFVRAKAAASETAASLELSRHPRLEAALRGLCERP